MFNKSDIMKHERLWSLLRVIDRTKQGWNADKKRYYSISKKTKVFYSQYDKLKEKIIKEIKEYNQEKNIRVNSSILIKDLTMMSNNGDQMGKVFLYNGDIYRGIYKERVSDFYNIWDRGILQVLWKYNIIPEIKLTQYYTEEFPLIIQMKKVSIQRNMNWSYLMVRDACCLLVMMYDVLKRFGCTILDGHLNNITFNQGKPLFVDIGSIILDRPTAVKEELVFCGLYRLLFGTIGNTMLYRMPVFDMSSGTAFVEPRFYNHLTRDYRFCRKKFLQFLFFRRGISKVIKAIKIFYFYDLCIKDIEDLFPVPMYKINESVRGIFDVEEAGDLSDCFDKHSIIDVGGGALFLEEIKDKYSVLATKYIDFNEKNIDQVYLRNYNRFEENLFAVINYIYIQKDENLVNLQADTVLCVLPYLNTKTYQELFPSTIAYQLNLIGKTNIVIVLNKDEDEKNSRLIKELNSYFEMSFVYYKDDVSVWKGTRKYNDASM